jgi:hypothetical protein
MDTLHSVLRSFNTETKSSRDHLTVFREFLAHLDQIQRKAPTTKSSRQKPPARAQAGEAQPQGVTGIRRCAVLRMRRAAAR